jgi:hypothetical protein
MNLNYYAIYKKIFLYKIKNKNSSQHKIKNFNLRTFLSLTTSFLISIKSFF